ncbi:protein rolling stone [Exaiptasia diaphana]|uniref:Protein rolling stone n=1 Tax=Exaiptasia diaphana TaxID=2652724 RepID=A0A913Y776_EXADI|nr:protein rolling stone [Exaiptasia diaphana]KXJ22177.1 hypothetical protein AC249_AIPGENE4204 [Exaiptasia diaphana]
MGVCCKAFCRELDIRNLGLKFHDPKAFTDSPALPLPALILFRVLAGGLWVNSLVFIAIHHPTFKVVLHFAYWSLFFVALYFIFGALISIWRLICKTTKRDEYHFVKQSDIGERDDFSELPRLNLLSWYHEVLWVLHTLAADTSFVVLVAYFTFWFNHRVTYEGYMEMMQHILPFVSMVFDLAINGFPVRLYHVLYANVFGFMYVVFSLIYILLEVPADLKGEPIVFPSLEFSNLPVMYTAWLSVFIVVGFFVSQTLFYIMYKIRTCLTSNDEEGKK